MNANEENKGSYSCLELIIVENEDYNIKPLSITNILDKLNINDSTSSNKLNINASQAIKNFISQYRDQLSTKMSTEDSEWLNSINEFYIISGICEGLENLSHLVENLYSLSSEYNSNNPSLVIGDVFASNNFTLFEHDEILELLNYSLGNDTEIFCFESMDPSLANQIELVLLVAWKKKSIILETLSDNENLYIPEFLSKGIRK